MVKFYGIVLSIGLIVLSKFVSIGCPFRTLTGIPDGGCGTMRSLRSLLDLDFMSSLRYNPLTIPLLLFISSFPFLDENKRFVFGLSLSISYVLLTILRAFLYVKGIWEDI